MAGPRIVAGGASGQPRRDGGPRSGRIFGLALAELDASLREELQIEPDVRGLVVLGADVGGANDGVLRAGDVIEAMAFEDVNSVVVSVVVCQRARRCPPCRDPA